MWASITGQDFMETGGLFEDTPMPEVPISHDNGEEGPAVGKSDGMLNV